MVLLPPTTPSQNICVYPTTARTRISLCAVRLRISSGRTSTAVLLQQKHIRRDVCSNHNFRLVFEIWCLSSIQHINCVTLHFLSLLFHESWCRLLYNHAKWVLKSHVLFSCNKQFSFFTHCLFCNCISAFGLVFTFFRPYLIFTPIMELLQPVWLYQVFIPDVGAFLYNTTIQDHLFMYCLI